MNDSSRLHMKHSVRHSSLPFNRSVYGRTKEAQDTSKTFFKASVEFLQVQSATMRNSLYDEGSELKKILDDKVVERNTNESMRKSKEEDIRNSGIVNLRSN